MEQRTRTKRLGFGYIEVLVSSLILALSILAALSLYGFSMNMINRTGDEGVAYNISRQNLENAREAGFDNTLLPDGTVTKYFDSLGGPSAGTSSATATTRFKMVRTVATDKLAGANPAPDAIRTVTIFVYLSATNEQIEQTGTLIVRSGV